MSRTFKDTKTAKAERPTKKEDPLCKNFRKVKKSGFSDYPWEEDLCPECGGLTIFSQGFLTCTECNWSTFETEELELKPYQLKIAI